MIALDTNLLVYAHREHVPEHAAARRAIADAGHRAGGAGIAMPSIGEFVAVVTHPANPGRASTSAEAAGFLDALVATAGLHLWVPGPGFGERLLAAVRDRGITGRRIFDLQIALIASEHGASEIWTHDVNFVTVPGLVRRDPLKFLKRRG